MITVTSFNGMIYYNYGQEALYSLEQTKLDSEQIIAYHENSIENERNEFAREIQQVDLISGVQFRDLFLCVPGFRVIIDYPEYQFDETKKPWVNKSKRTIYLNKNATNFYHKVAAMKDAICSRKRDLFCWIDADVFRKQPFDRKLLDYIYSNDICYLDRGEGVTESGIIFFNTNNEVVFDFIESWYKLALTKEIFKVSEQWADHNAFDFLRKNRYTDLKYGTLRSGKGRHVWYKKKWISLDPKNESGKLGNWDKGWKFFSHLKRPIAERRLRSSHLTSSLSEFLAYLLLMPRAEEKKLITLCLKERYKSKFPIHIVTDLSVLYRNSQWSQIANLSFSYSSVIPVRKELDSYNPFTCKLRYDMT